MRRGSSGEFLDLRGGKRQLYNEKLHNFYNLQNFIWVVNSREIIWVGHVACMRETGDSYKFHGGNPEGKKPLVRTRRR
jgi:hypothetical protein